MSSPYFHPQEEFEVWAEQERPGTRYLIEFADGESYVCLFDTAYDSENGGELDIETDHPLYDEFHQVSLRIIRTVQRGLRPRQRRLIPPRALSKGVGPARTFGQGFGGLDGSMGRPSP